MLDLDEQYDLLRALLSKDAKLSPDTVSPHMLDAFNCKSVAELQEKLEKTFRLLLKEGNARDAASVMAMLAEPDKRQQYDDIWQRPRTRREEKYLPLTPFWPNGLYDLVQGFWRANV